MKNLSTDFRAVWEIIFTYTNTDAGSRKSRIPAGVLFLLPMIFYMHLNTAGMALAEEEGWRRILAQCRNCHGTIEDLFPESHDPVDLAKGVDVCITCHSGNGSKASPFEWIMHRKHYASGDFSGDCHSCHEPFSGIASDENLDKMSSYYRSWAASNYLDHKHARERVTCTLCHGMLFPEKRAPMEQCFKCHGDYEQIAELTKDVNPNPHMSHFPDLRCTLCHMGHKPSELYCNQCHEFELITP